METTFWGPSGWKLLHMLAYLYPNDNIRVKKYHKDIYYNFYMHLRKILPCTYCRQSITNFISSLPLKPALDNKNLLTKWIFGIHNKVNNKLRRQRYCTYLNPSLNEIDNLYNHRIDEILRNMKRKKVSPLTAFAYMSNDFIGSMIYNYRGYVKSCNNYKQINEINEIYIEFFKLLAHICYLAIQELEFRTGEHFLDSVLSAELMQYYKSKPLNSVLKLGDDNRMLKINIELRADENADMLETWYYNLYCVLTEKNCTGKKQFDSFFKEHIVNTCNKSQPAATIKTCRLNPEPLVTIVGNPANTKSNSTRKTKHKTIIKKSIAKSNKKHY